MKIGVYAGSFDPVTRGHLAVVEAALKVVDILHVVVGVNPEKKGMFDKNERMDMLHIAIGGNVQGYGPHRVRIGYITTALTVEYARTVDATILVRGIRNGADYAYERSIAVINKKLAPEIETIFIPTPVEYEEVSSSTVKGLMKFRSGEVAAREFVPAYVLEALRTKIKV
jgi:pantetheine-phosphate adenylyltransferase